MRNRDQQAAEAYARYAAENLSCYDQDVGFLAGIAHARRTPSPEVIALVQALEEIAKDTEEWANGKVFKSYCAEIAEQALAAFKASGGGE